MASETPGKLGQLVHQDRVDQVHHNSSARENVESVGKWRLVFPKTPDFNLIRLNLPIMG